MWQSAWECPVSPEWFSKTSFCPLSVLLNVIPFTTNRGLNGTKKKTQGKNYRLISNDRILLWSANIDRGHTAGSNKRKKKKSNIKKLGYKAMVFVGMKSIATRQLSFCKIIAQSSLLKRHGCRVLKEMGRKLLGAVTQRNTTASLKILSAYELNVRGSGRVRCLLKRSQSRKTTFEHACARAHTQTLSISVLHFTVSGQQT